MIRRPPRSSLFPYATLSRGSPFIARIVRIVERWVVVPGIPRGAGRDPLLQLFYAKLNSITHFALPPFIKDRNPQRRYHRPWKPLNPEGTAWSRPIRLRTALH